MINLQPSNFYRLWLFLSRRKDYLSLFFILFFGVEGAGLEVACLAWVGLAGSGVEGGSAGFVFFLENYFNQK